MVCRLELAMQSRRRKGNNHVSSRLQQQHSRCWKAFLFLPRNKPSTHQQKQIKSCWMIHETHHIFRWFLSDMNRYGGRGKWSWHVLKNGWYVQRHGAPSRYGSDKKRMACQLWSAAAPSSRFDHQWSVVEETDPYKIPPTWRWSPPSSTGDQFWSTADPTLRCSWMVATMFWSGWSQTI